MKAIRKYLSAIALILLATLAVNAQSTVNQPFLLKQLAPGVWAAISNPSAKPSAVANAGFVIGEDGVLAIDTAGGAGKQLLTEIGKLTNLPVKYVVNTHYHPDHTAENAVFVNAGAMVVAHRNVRSWIHSENLKFFGPKITPQQRAEVEAVPRPTLVYDEGVDLYLGSHHIQLRSLSGHTGGDSIVFVPEARVAFGGDLLWHRAMPNLMDASIKQWIETVSSLARDYSEYSFVPGHGEIGTAADVLLFRDYLALVLRLVGEARAQGKSGEALTAAVVPGLTAQYGSYDYFKSAASRPATLSTWIPN